MVKIPESSVLVRFQDCDPMQHLNNVRYLDYFLNAREEHTYTYYAFSLMEAVREYRSNWVVTNHQIAYLRPALHGENVIIQTKLVHVGQSTLVIEATMLDAARKHLKAMMWSEMRFVSLESGRPVMHPEPLLELLRKLEVTEASYDVSKFQERIKALKQELKQHQP